MGLRMIICISIHICLSIIFAFEGYIFPTNISEGQLYMLNNTIKCKHIIIIAV